MSSRSIQVELPTGEVIWAMVAVDGAANVAANTLRRLDIEDLRRTVRGVSACLREAVDELVPDELQVEFGLELALKAGRLTSVLAEAGATASVKVTLTWKGQADHAAIGPASATT
ncbi:CU044_2847 family protein [Verrucosispora sp. WMMC514]|uniref:CU044_2847 family protein n=1 Tax=Verrucosispora sp. WMMC514 TaxID=3015156 RepID=UPI00248B262A|nr:CU044_2847 family protein [Verrucosispora sp. WMMC514]WBB93439.1 CU044_2847 family protein [Verrucosispora sp. WMMC514]